MQENISITFNGFAPALVEIDIDRSFAADAIQVNGTWFTRSRNQKRWQKIYDRKYSDLITGKGYIKL